MRSQMARSQSCSPPGHIDVERIGDLLGLGELPVGTGFFVVA